MTEAPEWLWPSVRRHLETPFPIRTDAMSEADQIAGAARAMKLILHERARQIDVEGYSTDHDDGHDAGQLAMAAAAYLTREVKFWPWEKASFRTRRHKDDLVKAGALILAELERLDRAERRNVTVT